MPPEDVKGETHQGNWYVLVFGLTMDTSPLTVASGLTVKALDAPLSVFDLAGAGAVGFREWAVLELLAAGCTCEIESAADAAMTPGYDALNRAWLVSALLKLRGFTGHLSLACSSYSWTLSRAIALGAKLRLRDRQLKKEWRLQLTPTRSSAI